MKLLTYLTITSSLLILSCSTATVNLQSNIDIHSHPKIFIKIPDDPWNFAKEISSHFDSLGFKVVQEQSDCDILATAKYDCHWDVAYRTFNNFTMTLTESKTNHVFAELEYVGGLGFNDCSMALDLVFNELKTKLQKSKP